MHTLKHDTILSLVYFGLLFVGMKAGEAGEACVCAHKTHGKESGDKLHYLCKKRHENGVKISEAAFYGTLCPIHVQAGTLSK